MFHEEITAVANAAATKRKFLKENLPGYILASMLAGIFVGFGVLLIFSIGGMLEGAQHTKIVMGVSFGIALSLVIIAGAELFTGNNFVMTVGLLRKTVTMGDMLYLWLICFIGNWIGSILLAFIFYAGGFAEGPVGEFIASASATKMAVPFIPLLLRGVLCNTLVCLAIWSSFRCKTDCGKLIMVFWCLFAFITTGFEHSIANMALLTISMFSPMDAAISWSGYFYNIFTVTLGNILGGVVMLAVPYFIISNKKEGSSNGLSLKQ